MSVTNLVQQLRENFNSGITRPLNYRRQQLTGIIRLLKEHEQEIKTALYQDVGKPDIEAFGAEIASTLREAEIACKYLAKWTKPKSVRTPLFAQPGKSRIYFEPLGVVLIIAPWNYPVQLLLAPLIGAIAAGNCAVVKPSELAPATSTLLASLLPHYVDPACLSVVTGGAPETTALLNERFDYIFYTGNGQVGRLVMTAAAKHLTPVTLELGGKSPCIIDQDIDLEVTARRIIFGKFYNAGQTCIAPDYILVHEAIESTLLQQLKKAIQDFYGSDIQKNRDYARIINTRHFQRLMQLLKNSGDVVIGGQADEKDRYLAPTILSNVPTNSPVMDEEIFGPILPVLKVKNIDEAITFVNARTKPLALYLFTKNDRVKSDVLERTSSGGVTINHVMMHVMIPGLPFGGVGASGMGGYHDQATFETFSHRKSVLAKPFILDTDIVYPPYSKLKMKLLRWLI